MYGASFSTVCHLAGRHYFLADGLLFEKAAAAAAAATPQYLKLAVVTYMSTSHSHSSQNWNFPGSSYVAKLF